MVLVLVRGLGGSDHPPRAPQRLVERRAVAEASLDDRRGDLRRQAFGELQLRREPGRHLRLRGRGIDAGNCRWAHSGGSFGVKHAVFPYIVLLALAALKAGRPIKWVESRLEHLVAATSATNRLTTLSAAVDRDGMVTALAWDQLEDCGAYLRAPEPPTLYRMHGNMTGAYRVRHLTIRNRVVLTNKT